MPKEVRYVVVLTVIAAVSAGALAAVDQVTRGPIAESRRARTLAALTAVMPAFDNQPVAERQVVGAADPSAPTDAEADRLPVVYVARKSGAIVGGAVQIIDPAGYGGPVKVLVGLEGLPAALRVRSFRVLEHKETPGLGTKAMVAPFATQFEGLQATTGALKVRKDGGTIEAVTGATITSRSVTHSVDHALRLFRDHADRAAPGGGSRGH
jgi:electron transport complex protein RnfG